MKLLSIFNSMPAMLAAVLSVTAGVAQAGSSASKPQRIEIGAIVTAAPTSELEGLFQLANGKLLQLSRNDDGVTAQLHGGVTRELLPVAANRLRSRDGRMEIAFLVQPDGAVTEIRLSLVRG